MSPIEIEPIKTTICGDKKKREIKSPQKIEVDLDCGCSPDKLCKMHKKMSDRDLWETCLLPTYHGG